jgi:hypothetical protein
VPAIAAGEPGAVEDEDRTLAEPAVADSSEVAQ